VPHVGLPMWRVIQTASKLVRKVTNAIITTIPITAPEKATRRDSVLRKIPVWPPTIGPSRRLMANGTGVKTANVIAATRASRRVYCPRSFRKTHHAAKQIGTSTVTATPIPCTTRDTMGRWRRAAKARARAKYNTVAVSDPIAITKNSRDVLRIVSLFLVKQAGFGPPPL